MSDPPYTFDSPDADIILRAPLHPDDPESKEFRDFHTHKAILSAASIVFRDMFSVPQPRRAAEGDNDLLVVYVVEPAGAFEAFLRLIYPIEPPVIDSLQIVDRLFQLAGKYMANGVHMRLKQILVLPSFLKSDPIWVYAIACRMDLDEEANLAIQHTYRIDIVRDISLPLLQAMTAEMYNRLLKSHAARREQLLSVVYQTLHPKCEGKAVCGPRFYAILRKQICLAIWENRFSTDRDSIRTSPAPRASSLCVDLGSPAGCRRG